MILTNLALSRKNSLSLYNQIIAEIKLQFHNGQIMPSDKLPSIRRLAEALQVSRTTIENAYNQLVADGYLINEPKKGYFASTLGKNSSGQVELTKVAEQPPVRYNFANNYIDPDFFPAELWRRSLNKALKDKDSLAGYGQAQGEIALRTALAKYSSEARGVSCAPEQIVIGAGVQSLLQILIDILQPMHNSVALEEPGFAQAERLFAAHHWSISHFNSEKLSAALPNLLYVSPSNPYKGRSLAPKERLSLINWANSNENNYILEDDYNGEFRYFKRVVSSLQGMSDGNSIIYFGSFSRLLLPSLRISYLVLPPKLLSSYQQFSHLYNQTSSTIEQLALADFINSGHLRRHVKRLRKLYAEKNILLRQALQEVFGNKILVRAYESGLHLRIAVNSTLSSKELATLALASGVSVLPVHFNTGNLPEILLSFAGIIETDIHPAILALKQAWS